jgi:exopolysaccharide biosynthesis polyprenyl glycosylphosphotransferase
MATSEISQACHTASGSTLRPDENSASVSSHGSERRLKQSLFVVTDLLAVWVSALLALYSRFSPDFTNRSLLGVLTGNEHIRGHVGVLLLYSGLIVLFCNTQRLYQGIPLRSADDEALAVSKAVVLATLLQLCCIYLSGLKFVDRFVVLVAMVASCLALVTWRRIRRQRLETRFADGWNCRNVLIVGQGKLARALLEELQRNRQYGYVVKGVLVRDSADDEFPEMDILRAPTGTDVISAPIEELRTIARAHFVDEIFICDANRELVKQAATQAREYGLGVHIVPDLYDGLAFGMPVEHLGRFPAISLPRRGKPALALMLKRWLDVVLSAGALIVTSPLLLLIALAVKMDSSGPVLYKSKRIGRKGREFRYYKFRTMLSNAEALKASLQHLNERDGVLFKIANDPRITRIGRTLRKYSLDELPQFWNVLKGDMSLVGPRPPLADEVRQYELEHLRRLDVLPGITGLWQTEARSNPSFGSYIALDIQYVETWNLLLDLKILLRTVAVVFAGSGQ